MKKIMQEHILKKSFTDSLEREELLIAKYHGCIKDIKDPQLRDQFHVYIRDAESHIKLLKDKMIMLNIQ